MVQGVPADQKKALVYEAFGYAEKALEKDDACFASHKVSKAHPHHLCVLALIITIFNSKIMLTSRLVGSSCWETNQYLTSWSRFVCST